MGEACPYKAIFEPGPPPGIDRLTKNQDVPRPFVFRPPLATKATYLPGEPFDFHLILLGKAVDYLPYFVLSFRDVAQQGFGLNRVPCKLQEVRSATRLPNPPDESGEMNVYNATSDELFRAPQPLTLWDWVQSRAELFPLPCNLFPTVIVRFLTPTNLKSEERSVRQPEFHHLFKRVRDRLNALSTFYGPVERGSAMADCDCT